MGVYNLMEIWSIKQELWTNFWKYILKNTIFGKLLIFLLTITRIYNFLMGGDQHKFTMIVFTSLEEWPVRGRMRDRTYSFNWLKIKLRSFMILLSFKLIWVGWIGNKILLLAKCWFIILSFTAYLNVIRIKIEVFWDNLKKNVGLKLYENYYFKLTKYFYCIILFFKLYIILFILKYKNKLL